MENTAQIYLQQLLVGLSDPMGLMLAVCMLGVCALVIATDRARWYTMCLAIFTISCVPPFNKWVVHVSFFFPVEFLRNWSRPLTIGFLLILATGAFRFERGARQKLASASLWWFVIYQVITALRLMTTSALFSRGMFALVLVGMLLLICVLSLGPALQSLNDVNRAMWACTFAAIFAMTATLIQWRINPSSVQLGGRLYGTTATPQGIGMLLGLTLPTMCYLLVHRKLRGWFNPTVLLLAVFIPLSVMMLIWTGARGCALTALVGVVGFFHRRMGRFMIAGAICVIIGLLLKPYLDDAFQISSRLFSTENTRAQVWSQMLTSIGKNPWFGELRDTADFYTGNTVGEGGFLMSLSTYGILGTIPLAASMFCLFAELQSMWRHRALAPELADLVDMLIGFWLAAGVMTVFESFILSYLTFSPILIYVMFVVQSFAVDYYRQAAMAAQGFPVVMPQDETMPYYTDAYNPVA